ncbi:MAG: SAM-dependent methyltransferase [Candidatus Rokuibacteriota bacterium]|nr:MAG: SAM-dependent methyltransferase [Candidatus Rokubacteria bacterium]
MTSPEPRDRWSSGDAYEPYVGRWSRLVAREFIGWLGAEADLRWLDVGCGTGVLTETIVARCSPHAVVGVDLSEGYLAHARSRVTDPRVSFRAGDAQALPVKDGEHDVVVSGLMLNFVPDQVLAVSEMRRALSAGGTAAAYVWDYAGEMQLMRRFWDAAVALDPGALELDEGRRFPIARPAPLVELFESAGLTEVRVLAIDVPTIFRDFDDYWLPFLGGQAPAPGYCMSLTDERRATLRERIRSTLPTRPDGSIHLIARAWAVRGIAD